jgi:3-oxoacyl-[acyl-carrier-protein] synthase II
LKDGPAPGHRVVVTGIGAVSGWGWGADELWRGLAGGAAAIGVPARFDTRRHRTRLAAEVPPSPNGLAASVPGWRRLSRADRFAVAAAMEACRQAGLEGDDARGFDLGVFFGGSTAGMAECERFFHGLTERRRARISLLVSHPLNAPGDAVARLVGARGPVQSLSSACASGALAIGAALDALRDGDVAMAVAGGADSLCHLTFAGFNSLRIVDAEHCRPFRRQRQGLNLGEGAGVLVLETLEHARRRGARPLAELLGAGASCDAHHMTAPHPQGAGAALALRSALGDAGVAAGDVGFVNAHGTGTPQNDAAEWRAIEQVFGERARRIPVTATKGAVGHLLGSSGAIEAVATVQCLAAGAAHAAPGDGGADEDLGVDLVVGGARPLAPDCVAVSTSFGFGGANAVLVLRGWPR